MNAGTQRPGRRSGQSWRTFPARWCYFEYPTGHRHLVQNPAPDGRSAENAFTLRTPPRGGGVRRYSLHSGTAASQGEKRLRAFCPRGVLFPQAVIIVVIVGLHMLP